MSSNIKLPSGLECAVGNLKVGKDTLINNITSATDCESLKRGLCQIPGGKCYALSAEKRYPDTHTKSGKLKTGVLTYRRRQTKVWDAMTAREIADSLLLAADKASHSTSPDALPIKYVRFQEAGDFRNQADVNKMAEIARLLDGKLITYTYTARKDLDFSRIPKNLIVNGSGFGVTNEFRVVDKIEPGKPFCRGIKGGGCYGCYLCKTPGHKVIQELLRGGTKKDIAALAAKHGVTEKPGEVTITAIPPKVTYGVRKRGRPPKNPNVSLGSSAGHN